ncbi:hypothetical protein QBC40DRAFT_163393 [Triangularia verruculosa]|uniref:Autophagy-related protein 33 n=1 Tax=Triangularia verruculosa TaxID=2587418 RepID=A0AAN7AZX4_9PEZI|nr:hypothetical protein QBC40DRAFT_163393 [Triangularia verruculosa]
MATRGVSALKFVGTVSLGLLTGLSYTLTTLTIPSLLNLPSATTALRAFDSLTATSAKHLRSLSSLSGTAFLLAYYLSPKPLRHPYLIYTSVLILGSQLAVADFVAPYLSLGPSPAATSSSSKKSFPQQKKKKQPSARARMEASYEVLGEEQEEETEEDEVLEVGEEANGEEVRAKVEDWLKKQVVQMSVLGLGFFMSVVGIWGDGVVNVYGRA